MRSLKTNRTRIAKLAKKNLEVFSDLESSSRAQALLKTNFHVAPEYPEQALPISQQYDEISGRAKEYECPEYSNLMSTLRGTRKQFLRQLDEKN